MIYCIKFTVSAINNLSQQEMYDHQSADNDSLQFTSKTICKTMRQTMKVASCLNIPL